MTRSLALCLLLLGTAHVTWCRNVDNVENFGEVEKKMDELFDEVDVVIDVEKDRVSSGRAENNDDVNEKIFEVIEDAEDLDDDIDDVMYELENPGGDVSTEERVMEDLDIMDSDATMLVTDARRLVNSMDTNPNGNAKSQQDPALKAGVESLKEKARDVVEALAKAEFKIKDKLNKKKKGKRGKNKRKFDTDMSSAQADDPRTSGHAVHRTFNMPDTHEDEQPPALPRHEVIDVRSSFDTGDFPDLIGSPIGSDSTSTNVNTRNQPSGSGSSSVNTGTSSHFSGSQPSDPRTSSVNTGTSSHFFGSQPLDPRTSSVDTGTSSHYPRSQPSDPRYQPDSSFSSRSSSGSGGHVYQPSHNAGGPSAGSQDPSELEALRRLEERRQQLEMEDALRHLEANRLAAPPAPPSPVRQNDPLSDDSPFRSRPTSETYGRTNRQYFDTMGLETYLDDCTNCVNMEQSTTCPLNEEVLELKKWANELQELLSFGCKKPESCTTPGICCVQDRYPFEQTVVQMTQMLKDVYNLLQDRCSKGCFGGPERFTQPPNWSPWGEWSPCDATCGQGIRERRRTCENESQGLTCEGRGGETEICQAARSCCEDGNWTPWSSWTGCSASCGQGRQERSRSCSNPRPNYCGRTCTGQSMESKFCSSPLDCCVDGNWGSWSRWAQCSVTCGEGVTTRVRSCSNPRNNYCGAPCRGDKTERRTCGNAQDCCVHGNWSPWNSWTGCSVSCGLGTKSRMRRCDNPSPNFCGLRCPGLARDSQQCDGGLCCVDGNWGTWANWESCSTTCGRGNQLRRRRCDRPSPNSCGRPCLGNPVDVRDCNEGNCCVDGNWGSWQRWAECSATCDQGFRVRNRNCDRPTPDWCGQKCPGPDHQRETCDSGQPCITCVHGNWGSWNRWSRCSASCGQGLRERTRGCNAPAPNSCGLDCFGSGEAVESCDSGIPVVNGNWGVWGSWSTCSASCGRGQRERMRRCDRPPKNACGRDCLGNAGQTEECDSGRCIDCGDVRWSTWVSWTRCSATCGTGMRKRSRTCRNPYPLECNDQNYCLGPRSEEEPCGSGRACCADVRWSSWSVWSDCSTDCGRGVEERARRCLNVQPGCDDRCIGDSVETRPCNSLGCCERVQYTSWSSWSACSASCGRGLQVRDRECMNPFPLVCDDRNCLGLDNEQRSCDSGRSCCVDGNWAQWLSWSTCSVSCGRGSRERRRVCADPAPNFCGERCQGREYDTDTCDTGVSCQPICAMRSWTEWSRWGTCSATCGRAVRSRNRYCEFLGVLDVGERDCGPRSYENCRGESNEEQPCTNSPPCPDPTTWGPWSQCSATCRGRGVRERQLFTRTARGEVILPGSQPQREPCSVNFPECPPTAEWSPWTPCSATCRGSGRRERRLVFRTDVTGLGAMADQVQTEQCQVSTPECPSWGPWSPCSATCRGQGIRERSMVTRTRLGSIASDASKREAEPCQVFTPACEPEPITSNSFWATWAKWCPCDCRNGKRSRRRECVVEDQLTGNRETVSINRCPGNGREEKNCDVVGICPECITSCRQERDGTYPSCTGCTDFIRCDAGTGEENMMRCNKPNTAYDAFVSKCVTAPSPSCSLQDCVYFCTGKSDGVYHSCSNCSSFVQCENERFQEMSCPDAQMEFNAHFGTCMGTRSPTCKRSIGTGTGTGTNNRLKEANVVGAVYTKPPPEKAPRKPRTRGKERTKRRSEEFNDAPADEYYDEKHGLNAEERREMYEKTREKTPEELAAMKEEMTPDEEEEPFEIEIEDPLVEEGADEDEDVVEGGLLETMKEFFSQTVDVPDCVDSCEGLKKGRYPSCKGCHRYWQCYNRKAHKRCPGAKLYDHNLKKCADTSATCPGN